MNIRKRVFALAAGVLLATFHVAAGVNSPPGITCDAQSSTGTWPLSLPEEPDTGIMISGRNDDFEMSSRGGARVVVYGHDGSQVYGDLLAINDSTVTVHAYSDFSYSTKWPFISGANSFRLEEIDRIVVKGRAHMLEGMVVGVLGGMLAGSVLTQVMDKELPSSLASGPAVLGGAGLISGAAIGYLLSGSDMEVTTFSPGQIAILRSLSRSSLRGPK